MDHLLCSRKQEAITSISGGSSQGHYSSYPIPFSVIIIQYIIKTQKYIPHIIEEMRKIIILFSFIDNAYLIKYNHIKIE